MSVSDLYYPPWLHPDDVQFVHTVYDLGWKFLEDGTPLLYSDRGWTARTIATSVEYARNSALDHLICQVDGVYVPGWEMGGSTMVVGQRFLSTRRILGFRKMNQVTSICHPKFAKHAANWEKFLTVERNLK